MSESKPRFQSLSENSLIIYFGDSIDAQTARRVKWACDLIRQHCAHLIIDMIPSYTSIHLTYDFLQTEFDWFQPQLAALLEQAFDDELLRVSEGTAENSRLIEIPVYYDQSVGLDLLSVAEQLGLSVDEVIQLHSQQTYHVYAIGFSPGFAYLGATDARLKMARRHTPRLSVPTGSVAIADQQTAVYPLNSPGGWHILGRTPMTLIDFTLPQFTPFQVGDRVSFKPVSKADYLALGGHLNSSEAEV